MRAEARRVANVTLYPQLAALTVDDVLISIGSKEFALARALFENPGAVVTHKCCFAALGGAPDSKSASLISVHIHNMRRKLRAAGAKAELATVYGRGYVVRELCPQQ
jgi:DNA-binding response OmpR family regulator